MGVPTVLNITVGLPVWSGQPVGSLTPTTAVSDPVRLEIVAKMAKWPQEYDRQNPDLLPYDISDSYVDLVFETI